VTLLEIGNRQPDQMAEQTRAHLKVQDILDNQKNQRPQGIRGNFDHGEQAKAESQNYQEIGIAPGDHLIDRELKVKRAGNHKDFEDNRKNQNLDERMCAAAQLRPESRKRESCSLVLGEKTF